jgi:hypothetical protein
MQLFRARDILKALVLGLHPKTHDELPKGTILEDADVVRALLAGVANIEQSMARASRRSQLPRNIGRTWTEEENGRLIDAFQAGHSAADIAARHGRTVRAIEARLEKLGLLTADQRVTEDRFGAPIITRTSKDGISVTLVELPKSETA